MMIDQGACILTTTEGEFHDCRADRTKAYAGSSWRKKNHASLGLRPKPVAEGINSVMNGQ